MYGGELGGGEEWGGGFPQGGEDGVCGFVSPVAESRGECPFSGPDLGHLVVGRVGPEVNPYQCCG